MLEHDTNFFDAEFESIGLLSLLSMERTHMSNTALFSYSQNAGTASNLSGPHEFLFGDEEKSANLQ